MSSAPFSIVLPVGASVRIEYGGVIITEKDLDQFIKAEEKETIRVISAPAEALPEEGPILVDNESTMPSNVWARIEELEFVLVGESFDDLMDDAKQTVPFFADKPSETKKRLAAMWRRDGRPVTRKEEALRGLYRLSPESTQLFLNTVQFETGPKKPTAAWFDLELLSKDSTPDLKSCLKKVCATLNINYVHFSKYMKMYKHPESIEERRQNRLARYRAKRNAMRALNAEQNAMRALNATAAV